MAQETRRIVASCDFEGPYSEGEQQLPSGGTNNWQYGRKDMLLRPDNGPEFVAEKVRGWWQRLAVAPLFIEPGSHGAQVTPLHSPILRAGSRECSTSGELPQ